MSCIKVDNKLFCLEKVFIDFYWSKAKAMDLLVSMRGK